MADNNNDIEMGAHPAPQQRITDEQISKSIYDRLRDIERVNPSDLRNSVLVVAALISAATFAAGLNPPSGVWQDDNVDHNAGESVLGTKRISAYKAFYLLNAAAFSSANLVIIYLVYNFPYFVEIWGAMFCMSATYGLSIHAVSPSGKDFNTDIIWFALAVPYILRIIAESWKRLCVMMCKTAN